jgi:hypothetical protein
MKRLIPAYKAVELSKLEGKTKPTIYNNGRLYIPIMITSKRAKKWYSIRYIKKSDLDSYLNNDEKKRWICNSTKPSEI